MKNIQIIEYKMAFELKGIYFSGFKDVWGSLGSAVISSQPFVWVEELFWESLFSCLNS